MSQAPTTANVTRPRAMGYGFALDDRLFRLTSAGAQAIEIVSADLEAPRVNTTSSPEEAVPESGLVFARSQFDGGEGLFRAHTKGAADNRFWASKGIAVHSADPDQFPEIRLLHDTSVIEASANSNLRLAYDDLAGALYMVDGAVLRRSTNPTDTTPTFADDDPAAAEGAITVHDVAVLGDEVYAALGANGIHRKVSGAWSHWNDLAATRIWSVKGRIVATTAGGGLYEVTATGAAPAVTVQLAPGESFTSVADGGDVVLAGASDGHVYAFGTDTGSLVLAGQDLFEGERVLAVGQSQGVVAIGTADANIGRLYVGSYADGLNDLQLVRQWGTTGGATARHPRRIVGTRTSLQVGVTDGVDTCLWRYDLITGGISSGLCATAAVGAVQGIVAIDDKVLFSVDGAGLYAPTDNYVSSGHLIGPLGDFYSSAEKTWVGARLETDSLASGEAVELYYATDPAALQDPTSALWKLITRRSSGSGDSGEMPLPDTLSRSLAGMVKLIPAALAESTPAVRSFSFRGFTAGGASADWIMTLRVNVSDQVERRGRRRSRVKGRGATEYRALQSLHGQTVVLTVYKPDIRLRGLVEKVSTPVLGISSRGSATLVSEVVVRGRIVSGSNLTTSAGPFATDRPFGTALGFGESAT